MLKMLMARTLRDLRLFALAGDFWGGAGGRAEFGFFCLPERLKEVARRNANSMLHKRTASNVEGQVSRWPACR